MFKPRGTNLKRVVCSVVFTLMLGQLITTGTELFRKVAIQDLAETRSSTGISLHSAAYYHKHLYVGSSQGLLEITNGEVVNVYLCRRAGPSVEMPFYDRDHDLLWVSLAEDGKLAYYDGEVWRLSK